MDEPVSTEKAPLGTAIEDAKGLGGRRLVWVVGAMVGAAGAVVTIVDALHHHQGFGPAVLAAGLFVVFLAALDMSRLERAKRRRTVRTVRRLTACVERLEERQQHVEHDREAWRRLQAEEAMVNGRLVEKLVRSVGSPRVSGGTPGVAATGPPAAPLTPRPTPPPRQRPAPRHSRRRPPGNQPRLFDQDEQA